MPPKSPLPGHDAAEALALQAVAMIAADEDLLPRFLALTGCGLDELRVRLAEPEFLGAVLDFVLESDETAQKLAELAGIQPETLLLARSKLPGGSVEW
jgi:hypothetical protein